MTAGQSRWFRSMISEALDAHDLEWQLAEDSLLIRRGGDLEPVQVGLERLTHRCLSEPPDSWPELVAEHVEVTVTTLDEAAEWVRRREDFAWVREQLAVRLLPGELVDTALARDTVMRQQLPGTVSALIVDRPQSLQAVAREDIFSWGLSEDELLELALDNVRRRAAATLRGIDLDGGVAIQLLTEASYLTASLALTLDDYPEVAGEHGTLVTIPHLRALIAYPINDSHTIQATHALLPLARMMYDSAPGGITPSLLWRRAPGSWLELPASLEDDTLLFAPPVEFVELLSQLGS